MKKMILIFFIASTGLTFASEQKLPAKKFCGLSYHVLPQVLFLGSLGARGGYDLAAILCAKFGLGCATQTSCVILGTFVGGVSTAFMVEIADRFMCKTGQEITKS